MKLLQKLNAIMGEVGYLQKDKKVAFGATKYNYASEETIKKTLHPLLVKHGILFTPAGVRDFIRDGQVSSYIMRFAFLDVESDERLEVEVPCSGHDSTDKGAYKAITGAVKYALTTTFLIPTGDDPEKDNGEPAKQTAQTAAKPQDDAVITKLRVDMAAAGYDPKQITDGIAYYERSKNKDQALDYLNTKIAEKAASNG